MTTAEVFTSSRELFVGKAASSVPQFVILFRILKRRYAPTGVTPFLTHGRTLNVCLLKS